MYFNAIINNKLPKNWRKNLRTLEDVDSRDLPLLEKNKRLSRCDRSAILNKKSEYHAHAETAVCGGGVSTILVKHVPTAGIVDTRLSVFILRFYIPKKCSYLIQSLIHSFTANYSGFPRDQTFCFTLSHFSAID